MPTYALFDNGTAEQVIIKLLNVEVKEALDIYFQSFRSSKVKESARKGIECAYEVLFSKDFKAFIQKTPISVTVKDFTRQVDGSSAGLAYSVAFAAELKKGGIIEPSFDIPEIIAATGEVDIIGNIRSINGLKEKILGAIFKNVELLFYPSENCEELRILLEQDKAFRVAVKNSDIKLKDVSSIRQLFCEIGILQDANTQGKSCGHLYNESSMSELYKYFLGTAKNILRILKYGIIAFKNLKILKVMLIALTIIIMCISIYRSHVLSIASGSVNLAYKRIAYASSDENLENSSVNAVDGNKDSRWSSEHSDQQWLYIDLGKLQAVSSVVLYWEEAYAKQYQIQVSSDGFAWAVVYSKSDNKGGANVINFDTVQARYVKMYAWQRATKYGYSLREFEVYGKKQARYEMQPLQRTSLAAVFTHYGSGNSKAACSENLQGLKDTANNNPPDRKTCTSGIRFTASFISDSLDQSCLDSGGSPNKQGKEIKHL
ncbi:Lon protease-like protein [Ruminiclostridium sufflavum DSM 19573]|uniref:Lon protease-like protein n=1 Tax=Ruminiclostridium sufflavum DSM 19573 TaxID=1121337 RepID=A0A318XL20_9FIRM|nr:discoidin domain-containing protein [Ruminiclostridium sufflavum]PYG87944.1 Lon protease-like protein [Ruminiclostridium sufflavum DSM 19573]